MDTAIAAIVAVVGTLLGAALKYHFQQKVTERSAALAIRERARQERLEAYATFASAAVRCRTASQDVYHREADGSDTETQRLIQAAFYRARGELTDAQLRVRLVCADSRLHPLMADVLTTATTVHQATGTADLHTRNDVAKAALSQFVEAAAAELTQPTSNLPI